MITKNHFLKLLENIINDRFMVFCGDVVMDFDMQSFIDFDKSYNSIGTAIVHPNDHPFDSDLYEVDENKRFTLHLAAVFASNFSNAIVAIAAQILHDKGLSLKMLYPLLQNTAAKWQSMSPADAQTGPARRNDLNVMQRHLEELNDEELKKIYQLVSEYIRKHS